MAPSGAPARISNETNSIGWRDNPGAMLKFPCQNRNDSVLKSVLNDLGQAGCRLEAKEMDNLVRYRAMESLCRQSAVFHPLESWRLLAEAEMWHHKALEEIAPRAVECDRTPPTVVRAPTASLPNAREESRLSSSG